MPPGGLTLQPPRNPAARTQPGRASSPLGRGCLHQNVGRQCDRPTAPGLLKGKETLSACRVNHHTT
jgi:hypothetical protein